MKRVMFALGVSLTMATGAAAAGGVQSTRPSAAKPATAQGQPQRVVGTTGRPSPVEGTLRRNPQLAGRIGERLPAKIDVMWAASGFRSMGHFVAAVNASNNLEIPFMTLKSRLLDDRMSLGRAIRDLRPSADYRKEARRAEQEAQALIGNRERQRR